MTRHRILVADDDPSMLEAIAVRLESEGFDVVRVQDAYQALATARRDRPDLLLLDVGMPAGDGFSVHERLAAFDELKDVPVIYVTGSPPACVDAEARRHGAVAIVHKPFAADDLLDAVRGALGDWVGTPA